MSLGGLQALRFAGLLPVGRYLPAVHAIRDETFWARWGWRALLALGAAQFLAGVVFFFAYNWNDLSDVAKFAVVESGVALAVIGALIVGLDRAFGQVLLIAASVLTGVLLAVIGQVYQTGADVFELFAAWFVLILPWTIAARSAAQWLLWLVVGETALALYGDQVLTVTRDVTSEEVWVMVGASVALALVAREVAVGRGLAWLSAHWTRLVLLFAAVAILFAPAAGYVLDFEWIESKTLCLAAFLVVSAVAAWCYGRVLPDFAALVILIGFADAFFICLGFRLIGESIGFSVRDVGPALTSLAAMIVWAIGGTGSAALAMRRLRPALQGPTVQDGRA